jgi:hypothetical protein
MSNPKTAIQEIKKLMVQFGFLEEKPALQSFKLEDKTILQAENLEVGKSINKINDAFESVALENGSYRIDNFNVEVSEGVITAVKEIFLEAKLVDGTIVKVEGEELVEGAAVKVVTEQGEVPAPDGVHELESGVKVQTVGGVVVKVEEPKLEVEVEMEDKMPEVEVEEEDKDKEMIDLIKKLMEKMSEKMKSMEDKMSSIENSFNKFKKEPAGKKVSDGKTEFNSEVIESENPKLDAIIALRNKKIK